jgi:hypothetical protein
MNVRLLTKPFRTRAKRGLWRAEIQLDGLTGLQERILSYLQEKMTLVLASEGPFF